jgi:NADH:ubiquinone oxidoreductase subunit C
MPANAPVDILRGAGVAFENATEALGAVVRVAPGDVWAALAALKAGGYEQLVDLLGTDTGEAIELTYHVRDFSDYSPVFLKAVVAYDGEIASVWEIYPSALFPEREAAELLGMSFPGHPNPKRLLTVEGTEPLLRKSVLIRGAEEVQYS